MILLNQCGLGAVLKDLGPLSQQLEHVRSVSRLAAERGAWLYRGSQEAPLGVSLNNDSSFRRLDGLGLGRNAMPLSARWAKRAFEVIPKISRNLQSRRGEQEALGQLPPIDCFAQEFWPWPLHDQSSRAVLSQKNGGSIIGHQKKPSCMVAKVHSVLSVSGIRQLFVRRQ